MKTVYDINIGDKASISATFGDADVVLYACMTGDFNPVHINREYAKKNGHERCVVHHMLVAGLISTVLGTLIPIPGSRVIRQNLAIVAPVYIGDTITAKAKVSQCNTYRSQVLVSVCCSDDFHNEVMHGDMLMELPEMFSSKRCHTQEGVAIHA